MRRSKAIVFLYSLGCVLLISLAGLSIYALNYKLQRESTAYSSYLLERYEATGKVSYLLQKSLLGLDRNNILTITDVLLDEGNYDFAYLMNALTNDQSFIAKAAESALFNSDFEVGETLLNKLPEGPQKSELIVFASKVRGDKVTLVTTAPITDAGKLMQMVQYRDFQRYTLRGEIGRSITRINSKTGNRNENILRQANVLYKNNLNYLALEALEEDPGICTADYYALKSSIHQSIGNYPEALRVVEEGLNCFPADRYLLERATEYHLVLGNRAEADYYRQRLKLFIDK